MADIDGTLLDSKATLRPTVRAAIERARASGVAFTLATGRRYATTVPLIQQLFPVREHDEAADPEVDPIAAPPVVLQAGALVVSIDGHTVHYRNPLPREEAARAIEILVGLGLQPILYENRVIDQRLFTGPEERDSRGAHQYLRGNPHLVVRRPYAELARATDPLQIAVIGDRDPLDAAIPRLRLANCRTILSYSDNLDSYFMEVFHRTCNKGRGAEQVARLLGLGLDRVVCIGDNWNDVEMMAMAGCGVAVANAAAGVTPYARRLAPSNDEDAVAVLVDQVLAGEDPGMPNPAYDPELLTRIGQIDAPPA